mmetsp:Transcript_14721/g.24927  ORF Transcript_14721/g.24927 Transcript_14721/m.24927 type:complete len:208 (-) Transcript_14721:35-658(-)
MGTESSSTHLTAYSMSASFTTTSNGASAESSTSPVIDALVSAFTDLSSMNNPRSRRRGTLMSCVREMDTESAERILPSICMASRECPPSSKKSSVAEISCRPSSSRQIPARAISVLPSGCITSSRRPAVAAMSSKEGAGRALRSTLPLLVVGIFSRPTNAEGIMYSGRAPRRMSRSATTWRTVSGRRPVLPRPTRPSASWPLLVYSS